jgi:hypothetical protein
VTSHEFETIVQLLEEWWPGQGAFDERRTVAWQAALGGYEASAVLAALHRLLQVGDHWRPSVAEVVAAITADPGRPTWDEAYRAIFAYGGVCWTATEDEGHERARAVHELVATFVRARGWAALRREPVNDEEWGPVRRRELQWAWEQHVERYDERRRDGRALEALVRPARGELARLQPLTALEGSRPKLPAGDEEVA